MMIKEGDYRMFEIYAREYKKRVSGNKEHKLDYLESKMMSISKELTPYVIEFCKLDIEFKENCKEVPDPIKYFIKNGKILNPFEYVVNTTWEGYWKRCTGKDLDYFISYLEYPIIYPKHENYVANGKNIINIFKSETGFDKVPYSIICAENINLKYFK
ncbi:MAG: hypothetical protein ACRCXA_02635 [Peptostreptococcaceae bacterium]